MKKIYNFELKDFAKLSGTTVKDIPEICRKIIAASDFRYRKVSAKKRAELVLEINQRIENNSFFTAGQSAKSIWQKRWSGRLKDFQAEDLKIESLMPKYMNKPVNNTYFRFQNSFIAPLNKNFELNWKRSFKYWLFGKYFKNIDHIYEFGCGTGVNIAILAELFPQKKLHCLDWVESSKKIAKLMAKQYDWNVSGHVFDMFHPNHNLKVEPNSAFLTFESLEQIGEGYKSFLKFALQKKIALFVSVEPIEELYDQANPFDSLAIKFIRKRHYLRNYLNYLNQMEAQKKIIIEKTQRLAPGNFHQDFSYIIWRPVKHI